MSIASGWTRWRHATESVATGSVAWTPVADQDQQIVDVADPVAIDITIARAEPAQQRKQIIDADQTIGIEVTGTIRKSAQAISGGAETRQRA